MGIPSGTLSCWTYKARQGVPGFALPSPAPEPRQEPMLESEPEPEPSPNPERRPEQAPTLEPEARAESTPKRRNVARVYTPSEKARALELAARVGVTAASREFGISRYSLYDWRRKVQRAAAGQGDSPTTGPDPADIEVRRDAHTERYEAVRPNHLWHLDFVHRHINRTNTFTFILIDDHSRFVVGHGVDDAERADLVIETFTEAVQRHGRPEAVMNEKGSAFWSWRGISRFTALLTELGVEQVVAEHKEWNGKVEVFNANIQKELFDAHRFYDLAEMKRRLSAHLHWYNHRRTHHALGGLLVPADRYYGRVEEVMARIEAGAGADLHGDLLDLRDRVLELFKVTSTDGKAEVWLMGQRIFGHGS